ncbi:SMP-30/gluconolactonase/LRE family protein [Arenicella xantha]|uniref:Gluconolactonase n=1 Tax=Arenicella xantha TaxID=644221 RepID=A0A395JPS2_9GAMM|nr:SMP-30/gluconolactonase/LRE family protein [Arenicella xantha]RBP51568.1 gluconolactonase [Arenicella xantha]
MASLDLSSLEVMASGLGYPEGPIHCQDGSILLVEIKGEQLTLVPANGDPVKKIVAIPGGPNGAAVGPNNSIYICSNGGFDWIPINLPTGQSLSVGGNQPPNYTGGSLQKYDPASKCLSTLYTDCSNRESPPGTSQTPWDPAYALCGPDDLVVDAAGGIWFSDWGKMRDRDKDITGIYYAAADGSAIKQVVYPLNNPNGIALSPDGKRLYVALTFERKIVYYDVVAPGVIQANSVTGPAQGTLDGSHLLTANFVGQSVLDSMAIDCEGNLYVATMLPDGNNPMTNGGISIVTPTGDVSYFPIELPNHNFAPLPSNICFGGPDMKTVYITCGASGYLLKARSEVAGLKLNFNGSQFDATTLAG